ncbi:MAG TPA: imelysin family protein [Ohtaekwangia sp.]|uniref:imelysin family protein n=1 Tax=Ohtaekwangia sp. TaxID=2066019 RepID=UPI002F949BA1
MKVFYRKSMLALGMMGALAACSDDNDGGSSVNETLNSEVIVDFSSNIVQTTYTDLAGRTSTLYDQVLALETDGATDNELEACRTTWKSARQAWEQSEAFLFGPVSTDNIDPRIDTWPVNFTDLDAQLNSDAEFNEAYINNLEDALKGFHPIEYLIFGEDGDKTAKELSARDIEYLKALALNLKTLTSDLQASWAGTSSGSYYVAFTTAGSGSTVYPTQLSAYEELVNAMIGICDEVANGKIAEVYEAKNPSLEESPFAKNSITDFTNNITGVQNVYLGKYTADGKGLEDLVRAYNLQLDSDLKLKITAAITSLNNVTVPFGDAITSQPVQIENAMTAINDLKTILEDQLLPFVQQHTK